MKTKLHMLAVWVLVFPLLAIAQSSTLDGTWKGDLLASRGTQALTFVIKNDGGKVAGTSQIATGPIASIEESTLSGSALKFKTKIPLGSGPIELNWDATVKGDEIAGLVTGGPLKGVKFTITRQK